MFDPAAVVESTPIAVAKAEDSVVNSNEQTKLIVLESGFSSGESRYKFKINSNGTGEIFYSDFDNDAEEFAHEVEVEKLAREIEEAIREQIALQSETGAIDDAKMTSIREEISAEMLEEFFWEEINQTLEDPFFRSCYDGEEWGEDFQTTRGTVDEFVEFLKLCVLTERESISEGEDYLIVEAETDVDAAGISDCSYYTTRLEPVNNFV